MSTHDEKSTPELPPEAIKPPVDKRVANELAFHLEMRTRELIASGMSPEEARRQAAARFGDLDGVVAELNRIERVTDRTERRTRYFAELAHDWRFALRLIARRRAFAAIAIITLGLGIGAATAIYSVVDAVLLRPLPYEQPDRIAAVWLTQPSLANDPVLSWLAAAAPMGAEEYNALRENAKSLRDVAMWAPTTMAYETDGGLERLPAVRVTSSLFPALRARPVLGRAFLPAEDALGGPKVAMLGWETWTTRFGADSSLIGRSLTLNRRPYTIIGVVPAGVRLDRAKAPPAFWVPALQDSFDLPQLHNRSYSTLARLAPGASFEAASQEAARIVRSATGDTSLSMRVDQWQRDQGRDARGPLFVLVGAVGLLLLIACVNVAILQLGEAAGRIREMTTRAALGAGSGRLVRQLLVESLAIAFAGAVVGTFLAWAMMRGLVAAAPGRVPGIDTVALDARVLAFTVVCATLTGLVFGIVPAIVSGRQGAASLVRIGAGQSGRGTRSLQRTLVASQLALSTVLLVEAVLLGRSLRALSSVDPGFRPTGVIAASTTTPGLEDPQLIAFTHEVSRRLAELPGVERVAAGQQVPFQDGASSSPLTIVQDAGEPPRPRHTQQRYVTAGYFETLGMRLIRGRFFTRDDGAGTEPVAIVSETEVKRDFGGQSPIGRYVLHQRIRRRIVGVVADMKYRGLAQESEAMIYIPFEQYPSGWPKFFVRGGTPATIEPALKRILRELEPRATVASVTAMPQLVEKSFAAERYRTVIVSVFGAMAALLAAVGLYGVSVRSAARRNREIGIRLALGGTSARMVRLLVGDAMLGVVVGLIVGLPAALLAGRLVRPYLFGITPNDPTSLVVVVVLLVVVTAAASFVPARLAGRSNPAVVLRGD